MCLISVVMDAGRAQWAPSHIQSLSQLAPYQPTKEDWDAFKKLAEMAKDFDRRTGQPDCEDPEKAKWFDEMDRRMKAIEEKLGL